MGFERKYLHMLVEMDTTDGISEELEVVWEGCSFFAELVLTFIPMLEKKYLRILNCLSISKGHLDIRTISSS